VVYPPQKYACKYKNSKIWIKPLFSIKTKQKSNKEFDKLTFGNSEFIECEICHFE
jgi:hypothetical protein